MEKSEKSMNWKESIIAIVLFVGVVLVWKYSWHYVDTSISDPTARGVFGDQFGFINSLFSGLAFAGVIYAILLQRKELKLQREELKMTRGELEGQKLQLEAQNNTFQEQTLQNAFFQMLSFHNEIVNGISYSGPVKKGNITLSKGDVQGRASLKAYYDNLTMSKMNLSDEPYNVELENMKETYEDFYRQCQHELGLYFRNLYNIIKFIHTKDFKDKKYFTNLVRAQFSMYEIILLLYNCEFGLGKEKFKPLIERYALLKTLDVRLLIHPRHKELYKPSSYK